MSKFVSFFSLFILLSCSSNEEYIAENNNNKVISATLTGKVQKGPFQIGSSFICYELTKDLKQTGKSFAGNFKDNSGNWEVSINYTLDSDYLFMNTSGYFVSEFTNKTIDQPLNLNAIVLIDEKKNYSVNLFTHIGKDRIEKLVKEGKSFLDAQKQVNSEMAESFNLPNVDLSTIDLFADKEENLEWLFISCALLRNRTSQELTAYLQTLRNELTNTGKLNLSQTMINDFYFVKTFVNTYKSNLSKLSLVPTIFDSVYLKITNKSTLIPESPFKYPIKTPNGLDNLLAKENNSVLRNNLIYSLSIDIPEGINVKIKVTGCGLPSSSNWLMTNNFAAGSFTLTPPKSGLVETPIVVWDSVVTIQVFENNNSSPILSKTFTVQ
jgi:hypothetical protein